jgi:High-temperature-induced dauer-formation protein
VDFLEFILELLENHYNHDKAFIPDSFSKIPFNDELLGIFFRLLDKNEDILRLFCENKQLATRSFKILMYNFCKSCENSHHDCVFFIAMSILIQLTQQKTFNWHLNRELDFHFSFKIFPVVAGTYGDFLIQAVNTAIIFGSQQRRNMFAYNMMSIVFNASPFLKGLSEATGSSLMILMNFFINYTFLLSNQSHPYCLIKLMIIFDSFLEFQLEANPALILEMYKKKNLFNRVMNLTFKSDQIKQLMGKTFELYLKELSGEE